MNASVIRRYVIKRLPIFLINFRFIFKMSVVTVGDKLIYKYTYYKQMWMLLSDKAEWVAFNEEDDVSHLKGFPYCVKGCNLYYCRNDTLWVMSAGKLADPIKSDKFIGTKEMEVTRSGVKLTNENGKKYKCDTIFGNVKEI